MMKDATAAAAASRTDRTTMSFSCGSPGPRRHPHGTLVSANHVSVIDATIGEDADVHGQRWHPGNGIWLVTSVQRDIGQD